MYVSENNKYFMEWKGYESEMFMQSGARLKNFKIQIGN